MRRCVLSFWISKIRLNPDDAESETYLISQLCSAEDKQEGWIWGIWNESLNLLKQSAFLIRRCFSNGPFLASFPFVLDFSIQIFILTLKDHK